MKRWITVVLAGCLASSALADQRLDEAQRRLDERSAMRQPTTQPQNEQQRIEQLQAENARLKQQVADLTAQLKRLQPAAAAAPAAVKPYVWGKQTFRTRKDFEVLITEWMNEVGWMRPNGVADPERGLVRIAELQWQQSPASYKEEVGRFFSAYFKACGQSGVVTITSTENDIPMMRVDADGTTHVNE